MVNVSPTFNALKKILDNKNRKYIKVNTFGKTLVLIVVF